jgi:hypothetical protein
MYHSRTIITIHEFKELNDDGSYFMDPAWQRDAVWSKKEQVAFIDAVLSGTPIPEICLWVRPDGVHVVVDGKQRSTALLGFLTDDFCGGDDVWFSHLSDDEKANFLDTNINVLRLGDENDEEDVIKYYKDRNMLGKKLTAGEIVKAGIHKPLVCTTTAVFAQRTVQIAEAFGTKKPGKRSADLLDRVPYLASLVGGLDYLTTSGTILAPLIANTTDERARAIAPQFALYLDRYIEVCRRLVAENSDLKTKWVGFPPLGKTTPIWASIIDTSRIGGQDPVVFWSAFYGRLRDDPAHKLTWDTQLRNNSKAKKVVKDIAWARTLMGN